MFDEGDFGRTRGECRIGLSDGVYGVPSISGTTVPVELGEADSSGSSGWCSDSGLSEVVSAGG